MLHFIFLKDLSNCCFKNILLEERVLSQETTAEIKFGGDSGLEKNENSG